MMKNMWQWMRRIGIELYCFFTAPVFVRNCLSMLAVTVGFIFFTFSWLKCYTHHGESMEVPNFVNMTFREASKKAKARDFRVAVTDSMYISGRAPGEIISQNPLPGARVKEQRTIYFTVTKNNPDVVRLPDLTGSDDYDMYSRKIARLGVKPRIAARVSNDKLEPNTIIHVIFRGDTITDKLDQGIYVEMGASLDFVISEKISLTVEVPDCICMTYDEAKFLLQSVNINLGATIKDGTVTQPEKAYVYRQNPRYAPGMTMRVGEQLDLYLTQQRPSGCPSD